MNRYFAFMFRISRDRNDMRDLPRIHNISDVYVRRGVQKHHRWMEFVTVGALFAASVAATHYVVLPNAALRHFLCYNS
ncbi:hypothetical protein [Cupriavidus pampae]|uniref:hypothetical protein n=1 Tax=Cupriavidus pampae TaxID=659251 RepID=UPI001CC63823|nr:hypothetical protein [Cupriavidus pampae]